MEKGPHFLFLLKRKLHSARLCYLKLMMTFFLWTEKNAVDELQRCNQSVKSKQTDLSNSVQVKAKQLLQCQVIWGKKPHRLSLMTTESIHYFYTLISPQFFCKWCQLDFFPMRGSRKYLPRLCPPWVILGEQLGVLNAKCLKGLSALAKKLFI